MSTTDDSARDTDNTAGSAAVASGRSPVGKPVIAVDAMGGDFGPSVVVPGAFAAARERDVHLLLVGQTERLEEVIASEAKDGVSYEIIHASEVAGMEEKPSDILRRKKDASIQVACRLVRDGVADGIVSAGHSGATVACGMFIIGRVPHVDRPALATLLPTEKKPLVLLDVGANVDSKPHHLFQFGLMADAFARDILGHESPRVGLLSIGEEEGKGNMLVKEAYELFRHGQNINFIGNVEGRDLYRGDVDVVVCDGFVGNVALKLSEGLASSFGRMLKKELLSRLLPKLGTWLARSAFRRFSKFVDYAEYGGAPLLGLQGITLICHGASNSRAIQSAVKMAATFVEKETNSHLIAAVTANEELTRFVKAVK